MWRASFGTARNPKTQIFAKRELEFTNLYINAAEFGGS